MWTNLTESDPERSDLDSYRLAAAITKKGSSQTYWTIRLLADRKLIPDAFRAYAYFRWADDQIDLQSIPQTEKFAFLERQQGLLAACCLRQPPGPVSPEEQILVDLVQNDPEIKSGLQVYLNNMMSILAFDLERRGRLISRSELVRYSFLLSTAVTEALHYFIGHGCAAPRTKTRYQAVCGAHIVHMLRDAQEDAGLGYYNIPREIILANNLSLTDFSSPAYLAWVASRVRYARLYLNAGRIYISQVKNLRCRLAGYAYTARFEWVLHLIERDQYRLRSAYPERKSLAAGFWMTWRTISSLLVPRRTGFSRLDTPHSTVQE